MINERRACPARVNAVKDPLTSQVDAENSSSSFREEPRLHCATKQSDVVLLACIQLGDIAHHYTALASFDQFNLVTNADFALLQHGKIEARVLARQAPLDDIRTAELVTRHPRLGHHYITRADPTRNLSPMFSSDSKSPALVKFSPNMPQGSFISGNSCFQ